MVECSEQSGALFLLTALIMQPDCWHAVARYFTDVEAVLGTMEALLCFEAWLDQYTLWKIGDPSGEAQKAEEAIALLMKLIRTHLPRLKGNNWKVSKFHEMKHMVRFITMFGSTRGYNASRPEEHHKAHAKRPGRRSQKIISTIDQQCGRRIADTIIIDTMHELFRREEDEKEIAGTVDEETGQKGEIYSNSSVCSFDSATIEEGSGTRYCIRCFRDPHESNRLRREVIFHTQTRGPMDLESNLSLFIFQSYRETDFDENEEGQIDCCTEYHKYSIDTRDTLISIRCHPNYRGKEIPWYDWALVRFVDDNGETKDYPSRIVCCIKRHGIQSTFDLVVQCCDSCTGRESILFTEWTFKTDFYVVSATAVVSLCFVIPSSFHTNMSNMSSVLVVKDKADWASSFYETKQNVN